MNIDNASESQFNTSNTHEIINSETQWDETTFAEYETHNAYSNDSLRNGLKKRRQQNKRITTNITNEDNENLVTNDKNDVFTNNRKRRDETNTIKQKPPTQVPKVTNVYTTNYQNITQEEDENVQRTLQEMRNRSSENGLNWIEIEEVSLFWDSLKANLKNVFQINIKRNINEVETDDILKTKDVMEHASQKYIINENNKMKQEVDVVKTLMKKNNNTFPLSIDTLLRCLQFLSADKILECEVLNKLTSKVINTRSAVFKYVKSVTLNEKWAQLPIFKRQYYLRQMERVRQLKISDKAFFGNGMYIHEAAALIFQNAPHLKSLEILSPEIHSSDNAPRHDPFAFSACCFKKLEKLTIIGCQTLEWLHIFRNASFPSLKKFEVCYYPVAIDNKYWEHNFDFTILGVQGLYKLLYTMENLQRVTIGFDVLFDKVDAEVEYPVRSRRNLAESYNIVRTEAVSVMSGNTIVPPAHGYPSRRFKSYRGRLCEEDYSDIFSITYFIAGKYGKLKRIMIKYRNSYEITEDENEAADSINEFVTGAANTASVCYNYVINWFRSPREI